LNTLHVNALTVNALTVKALAAKAVDGSFQRGFRNSAGVSGSPAAAGAGGDPHRLQRRA
jgi:hypothetical protein